MSWIGGFHNGSRIVPYEGHEGGNRAILETLASGRPAMITRYGIFELRAVAGVRFGADRLLRGVITPLCDNAGFFPRDESLLPRFAEIYATATRNVDCFAACNYRQGLWAYEQRIFRELCPNARLIDIRSLDSFCYAEPWTWALRGRKVLVVHPFARTIQRQYLKREKLFINPKILPEFGSLHVLPAVQSIAGNQVPFATWFDALEHMCQQISQIDFEVALIGAGAYGLPLAAHVKHLGKQAVHMGGVTQMLFGIRGRRWDNWYPHLFNEHWVRPADDERPVGAERVEHGCYW
ncbi:hypothetical protein [Fontivita pretiosa]|uniref:hypothetical protein n=1 Tax=Fontivita pretiosa TaxID=2989684 RepID=UPI003D184BA4